jgi:hypothetical protein
LIFFFTLKIIRNTGDEVVCFWTFLVDDNKVKLVRKQPKDMPVSRNSSTYYSYFFRWRKRTREKRSTNTTAQVWFCFKALRKVCS